MLELNNNKRLKRFNVASFTRHSPTLLSFAILERQRIQQGACTLRIFSVLFACHVVVPGVSFTFSSFRSVVMPLETKRHACVYKKEAVLTLLALQHKQKKKKSSGEGLNYENRRKKKGKRTLSGLSVRTHKCE